MKKQKVEKKPFNQWGQIEVEKVFGLEEIYQSDILEEWLAANIVLSPFEGEALSLLRKKAQIYISVWNETDYTANFISNVFSLVDFNQIKYSTFYEASVNLVLKDFVLHGRLDLMIAAGRGKPETPYFFMQEFKQEKGSGDAIAQTLLAMLFAQQENQQNITYGGYINGRNWFFMILKDNQYVISEAYIATKEDDLKQIFRILKKLKEKIEMYF